MGVSLLPLETDGTLVEIFGSTGRSFGEIAFFKSEVEAFERKHRGALLDEEHATLMLQFSPGGKFVVATMERDGCGILELPLEHEHIWKASDGHQVAVPSCILEQQAASVA